MWKEFNNIEWNVSTKNIILITYHKFQISDLLVTISEHIVEVIHDAR